MQLQDAIRLNREGKLADCEKLCRDALDRNDRDEAALHMLGTLAQRRRRFCEAAELIGQAVRLCPDNPRYRVDLAAALGSVGRPADAIPHLAAALKLKGDIPELHNNLGVTLEKLDRFDEAIAAYRNAIGLRRDYAEAHHNIGNVLRKAGRMSQALPYYREAVRLRPDYLKAVNGLAGVLCETAQLDEAFACFTKAMALAPSVAGVRSAFLYTIHYSPQFDAEALWREHRQWGRSFCDPLREQIRAHENDRDPDRRLRVGYVSPDLREHTVTKFITAAIEHHDRASFELFCYSDVEKPDAITQKLKGLVEHWHETRAMKNMGLEQLIRQDQIDILVDLRGHAADNRMTLFARKPAPIQVTMVGYFDTTGLSTMDYRITDEQQDPPGMTEQLHTEQLVRLPHSCWCYTADDDAPEVKEPPALKNGYLTFGSLNKIVKVSEPCAKLWARVMGAVARSRLVLSVAESASDSPAQAPTLPSPGVPGEGELKAAVPQESQPRAAVPHNCSVHDRLSRLGLPVDRIELLGKTATRRQYLERFNQIDIALDTFPFNGITTTCDGLWQGVPCVSRAGGTSVSRAGRSILAAANLPELATDAPDAFVRAAVELATNFDRLRELRLSMRQRLLASPLMDHEGFARDLESAYRQMWRAWCADIT